MDLHNDALGIHLWEKHRSMRAVIDELEDLVRAGSSDFGAKWIDNTDAKEIENSWADSVIDVYRDDLAKERLLYQVPDLESSLSIPELETSLDFVPLNGEFGALLRSEGGIEQDAVSYLTNVFEVIVDDAISEDVGLFTPDDDRDTETITTTDPDTESESETITTSDTDADTDDEDDITTVDPTDPDSTEDRQSLLIAILIASSLEPNAWDEIKNRLLGLPSLASPSDVAVALFFHGYDARLELIRFIIGDSDTNHEIKEKLKSLSIGMFEGMVMPIDPKWTDPARDLLIREHEINKSSTGQDLYPGR